MVMPFGGTDTHKAAELSNEAKVGARGQAHLEIVRLTSPIGDCLGRLALGLVKATHADDCANFHLYATTHTTARVDVIR
jgi:hypothetical protein